MNKQTLQALFYKTLKDQDIAYKELDTNEYQLVKVIIPTIFSDNILIFEGKVGSFDTPFYSEGFQMLSQTGGTFGSPKAIGRCPDDEPPYSFNPNYYCKIAYNYIIFRKDNTWCLLGFTSCNHYSGVFEIYPDGYLKVFMSLDGSTKRSGDVLNFEKFTILCGDSKDAVLKQYAKLIQNNHKTLTFSKDVNGWCSWYWYYEKVTDKDIYNNLEILKKHKDLSYVQIDDGYQTFMGDWLDFSDKFPDGLDKVVKTIIDAGKEPALWVAPFIVSEHSRLFKEHPDYLLRDYEGNLVSSDKLTYGGWRDTPWYVLDFSNYEVIKYIQKVFRYFHNKLKIKYYKLDACYWAAIAGYRYNRNFSRVDNYRAGLESILEIVGQDSFVLGCNAPMWPSLGLVHGMRISDDIVRNKDRIHQVSFELFNRLWMNKTLWLNDPDCLCLKDLGEQVAASNDYSLHKATILLSDGVFMLGDALETLDSSDFADINKILDLKKQDKEISYNDDFTFFKVKLKDHCLHVHYNFGNEDRNITLENGAIDFFSCKKLDLNQTLQAGSALVVDYKNS